MDEKKWLGKEQWKTMLIVFVCILVNYFGKRFAQMLTLPVWLDSFGTVFSAYTLGPIFGAIVGGAGSIINAFWNPNLLA